MKKTLGMLALICLLLEVVSGDQMPILEEQAKAHKKMSRYVKYLARQNTDLMDKLDNVMASFDEQTKEYELQSQKFEEQARRYEE